jgi:hypothetical protein
MKDAIIRRKRISKKKSIGMLQEVEVALAQGVKVGVFDLNLSNPARAAPARHGASRPVS